MDGFSIPQICKIRGPIDAKSKAMITQKGLWFKNLNFFTQTGGGPPAKPHKNTPAFRVRGGRGKKGLVRGLLADGVAGIIVMADLGAGGA